ncbi:uncharacterized protein LOC130376301 isoform X1 [Gadus chalcogrammus]|uniref:uncharacterized protein LOC130376301 isoform X1 n=1 Tax=Gadus chalcogrammus TaxID=1042646 RepID=UPI0024C47BD9|nr:uncharacterized protein LOC130376301 isoform X1 [Gadus chalcogrammus]XP_056439498.1 uncharacterized protein LOC130376301 isoform X1 [Gadus chalcogrammus]XP_056439499.1 uncharacterized protein LOC130376301 isoform X1 [Gadus chalcogrammus]XP_056439500.1 uncharacterized protein LOC130376301 isoform X1 [Gadus chalcogrammus]
MMYRCYICRTLLGSSGALVQHLKLLHGLYPGKKLNLICAQDGCCLEFRSYSGFRKHLKRVHCNINVTEPGLTDEPQPSTSLGTPALPPDGCAPSVQTSDLNPDLINERECSLDSKHMCASVIAKLQGSGVANTVILSVVESMEECLNDIHTSIKRQVLEVVPEGNPSRSAVEEVLENLENPFADLNTDSKWKKYFYSKWGVVQPVEVHLGVRYDSKINRISGNYKQVPVNDTFIYVPLFKTLEFIFKNKIICSHIQSSKFSDLYSDFCGGSYFKSNQLFSSCPHALQIQVYYDDFETANPLGSKAGLHKLGCLYFTLRNLPPHLNSSLMNIHLISLFHSQDAKKYGLNKILKPFIDDVKKLEVYGMEVSFTKEHLYGTISQITGDNLGLNGILGYVESFSATYYCRFCVTDKATAQSVFCEHDPRVILRSKELNEQHYTHLENTGDGSCYGIKRNSILNELRYFSVVDNVVVDIMHDLLEGVAQYEVKLLFDYLAKNFLSSEHILLRIYGYSYGYLDRKNRPTKINIHGNGLGLNASQTMCLLRNIPLIFANVVPENDNHWNLLLLLLDIVYIVFSPNISEGMTVDLRSLIAEHHTLFKQIYPTHNLIPKHHLMIHYPSVIRKIGPLLHVWTMRYEAKHRFFKSSIKNFKNVTKPLALKHQLAIAYHWEAFTVRGIESGPVKTQMLSELDEGELVCVYFQLDRSSTVSSWVKCDGIDYHIGSAVCVDVEEEMPLFGKIVLIILKKEAIHFVLIELNSVYVEHLHAFQVEEIDHMYIVNRDDLQHHKPFDLQMSYGCYALFYIVPDCCIL